MAAKLKKCILANINSKEMQLTDPILQKVVKNAHYGKIFLVIE
jgi:hypothetical protein